MTQVNLTEGQIGIKFSNSVENKLVEYVVDGVRSWGIVTHCLKVQWDGEDKEDSLVCLRKLQGVKNLLLHDDLGRLG